MIQGMLRRLIRSKRVQRAALASGALEEIARPYVAGVLPTTAADTGRELRSKGLELGYTYLPTSESESESPAALEELLINLGDDARGVELSVKPSQLGIRRSTRDARATLRSLADDAGASGAMITLEMQGAEQYADTIRLWREVHDEHPDLGLTLPADIRRSERDVQRILDDAPRLRLCIGSYPVPRALGYGSEHQKSKALVRCLRTGVEGGARVMLASHDPRIIAITQELGRRNPVADIEFQMFYGVRPLEQRRLADIGQRSRVLLPYGPGWYEYLLTRVARRPQTAWGYLRAVFDKR
ncbi:MAG: hypothetical protein E7L00_09190 [Propionibacteriaceae bacterium]|nr:hypothetical protein [Propionibacteriaceae bacterium]